MNSDFKDVQHKACLMLMVQEPGAELPSILPIQPGADLWLTEELGNDAKTFPMLLSKVSRRKLEFRCACRTPGCTRRVTYTVAAFGIHPQKEAAGVQVLKT